MPEPSPIGYFARGANYVVFTDRETGDVVQVDYEGFNVRLKVGDQSIVLNPADAERLGMYLIRQSVGARVWNEPDYPVAHLEFINRVERKLQATESDDECVGEHGEGDGDEDDLDDPHGDDDEHE